MRIYVNYKNSKGNYEELTIETSSRDRENNSLDCVFSEMETVDIINALIPEIKKNNIVEILEIFEDNDDEYYDDNDEDYYSFK